MTPLIGRDLTAFIEGPVMTIIAAPDAAGRAAMGRGVGTRGGPDGLFDTMVSRAQWAPLTAAFAPGKGIALTFVRPSDYVTYQLKGVIEAVAETDAADAAWARRYIGGMMTALGAQGVSRAQASEWGTDEDIVRVRYRPAEVFVQTPGPRAGKRLADSP